MTRYYPFAALAEALDLPEHQAAVALRLSGTTEKRYRDQGVTWPVADRLAVRAGFHPAQIWPEWIDHAIEDLDDEPVLKVCDECGSNFDPYREQQRFCRRSCYRRHHARNTARRRRQRPDIAEQNRDARRRYYAENAEYEKARERRRYHQGAA